MTPQEAVEIVARMAFAAHGSEPSWEDYPDIGEQDWDAVRKHAERLGVHVVATTKGGYVEAYNLLASRAEVSGG